MSETLSLKDLSPAQRKTLLKQLSNEEKKAREARKGEFDAYKKSVATTVDFLFPKLQDVSKTLTKMKQLVYDKTKVLLDKKAALYESSVDNYTHTFTNEEGDTSITIGHRIVDGWDDTVNAGIEKVKKFMEKISSTGNNKDQQTKFLIETVNKLLSKDAQGNLKASRVLELKKAAENVNDKLLKEGIEIIESAYKPKRTKNFVTVTYKDTEGKELTLPLSITDAEIIT